VCSPVLWIAADSPSRLSRVFDDVGNTLQYRDVIRQCIRQIIWTFFGRR
jgi:hypothetical protein